MSAVHEASMMFVETPTVVHTSSPSVDSISTRNDGVGVGVVVEDADLVVGEVDVLEPGIGPVEGETEGGVEGVDRTVALAHGDASRITDPDLHGCLGLDAAGAMRRRDTVALDGEERLGPPAGLAHQQLERRIGRLEDPALGLELLELLGEGAGGAVVELDAELLGLHRHAGPAAEVGHEDARVVADDDRVDVLVGRAPGAAQGRGVQAALVGERRRADVGVGVVRRQVDELGHVAADGGEPVEPALGQAAGSPSFISRFGMQVIRLALPVRSP